MGERCTGRHLAAVSLISVLSVSASHTTLGDSSDSHD